MTHGGARENAGRPRRAFTFTDAVTIDLMFGDIAESVRVWKVVSVTPSFVVLERDGQTMTIQNISRYEEENHEL